MGDWTDEKPTGLSIGTGIGLGVIGVDLPMDLRDLGHTVTHPELSYKWGQTLAFNTIGLFPLIGVIKNAKNLKYLDDAGELAKRSDDAVDAAGDAGRRADSPSNPPPDAPANPQSVEAVAPNKAWPKATSEYIDETRYAFEKSGGVRERFWKNEFQMNSSSYSPQNQALIKQGKAPFGTDGKPMVLHHVTPIEYGGSNNFSNLRPMRYSDHSLSPNFGPLHTPPFPE